MSELINALSSPGSMGQAQWLVLAIAAFVVVGSGYFVWKLYRLVTGVNKTPYKPNIGLSRLNGNANSVGSITGYDHSKDRKVNANTTDADAGSVDTKTAE